MNQNLLIVDDELEILCGLEELFRYDFPEEVNVYTANSAPDALKLLNQIRFDVVLTDIKMPGMDGISLYKKIKENWPRSKTVFLTGFHNFEDMYQVVNDPGVRYILKSEEDEVIMGAVQDAFLDIQKELEQEENRIRQKVLLETAQSWMQKALLDQMISGELSGEKATQLISELTLPISIDRPVLAYLLRLNEKDEIKPNSYYLAEGLCQIIQENSSEKIAMLTHIYSVREIILFVQPVEFETCDYKQLFVISKGAIEYSREIFQKISESTFSAVLSNQEVSLVNCAEHVKSLKQKLLIYQGVDQGLLLCAESGTDQKWSHDDVKLQTERVPVSMNLSTLKLNLEYRKRTEYFQTLSGCFVNIQNAKSQHDTAALEDYYSIAVFLLQFINENHLAEQIAFKTALYKLTRADLYQDWTEAMAYLIEVSEALFEVMDDNEITLTERVLDRVIEHIDTHLSEELSLTDLAELSGFNASYLSRLFKQVKKENLSDYILHKRIKLAKKLLSETNEKIQDIALKTGYMSAHSFSRVFRKETGLAPKEYREMGKA